MALRVYSDTPLPLSPPPLHLCTVTEVSGYAPQRPGDAFTVRLTLGATTRVVSLGEEVDLFVLDATVGLPLTPGGGQGVRLVTWTIARHQPVPSSVRHTRVVTVTPGGVIRLVTWTPYWVAQLHRVLTRKITCTPIIRDGRARRMVRASWLASGARRPRAGHRVSGADGPHLHRAQRRRQEHRDGTPGGWQR